MIVVPKEYVSREQVIEWINGAGHGEDFYVVAVDLLTLMPHRMDPQQLRALMTALPHNVKVTLLLQLERSLGKRINSTDVVIGHEPPDRTET